MRGAGSRERAPAHLDFRVLEHGSGATGVARVHVRVRAQMYRAGSYIYGGLICIWRAYMHIACAYAYLRARAYAYIYVAGRLPLCRTLQGTSPIHAYAYHADQTPIRLPTSSADVPPIYRPSMKRVACITRHLAANAIHVEAHGVGVDSQYSAEEWDAR